METWLSKVIIIFIVLVISLLFGIVPIKLVNKLKMSEHKYRSMTQKTISLLNCFAGGVFLATTFLALFPEVKEMMDELLQKGGINTPFPITEFMVTGGMFVIMFIEHLVMTVQHHKGDVSFPSTVENSYNEEQRLCHSGLEDEVRTSPEAERGKVKFRSYGSTSVGGEEINRPATAEEVHNEKSKADNENQDDGEDSSQKQGEQPPDKDPEVYPFTKMKKNDRRRDVVCASHRDVVLEEGACVHVIKPTHHQHHHIEPQQLGGIRSFLFLLAMSIHTVFEGLAIGLQPNTTAVWSLFFAVIVHKIVIAFSLGIQFAENIKHTTRAVLFIVFFAVMSPLGTAIGTAMTESGSGESTAVSIASVILQGLSTGVFLYVTFFE